MKPAPCRRAAGFWPRAVNLDVLARPAASAISADGATLLFRHETAIFTAVVERVVATGEASAPAVRETRAVEVIDRLCAGLDPEVSGVLPTLLRLVEWGPALFDFRFTRFSKLSDAEKDASLRAWMTSRLGVRRRAFYALRNLSYLGYYSQEATWALIGYRGPFRLDEEAPA
jgi:hypothetical protein